MRTRPEDAGLSLVEVLVTTAVIAVALGLSAGVFGSGLARTNELEQRIRTEADTRLVLDAMRSELRQAYTGSTSIAPVAVLGPTTITFYSPDDTTPFRLRKIAYRVVGGVLERSVSYSDTTTGPPWAFSTTGAYGALLGGVVNVQVFTGLDSAGIATTDPAAVRAVAIALDIDPQVGVGLGEIAFRITVDFRSAS